MNVDEALSWYDDLQEGVDYKIEHNKNAFAILLNTLMMAQNINKAELAARLEKSAPYITKVLRGDENLTISSMTTLLDAIDCDLHINGCHRDHEIHWHTVITGGLVGNEDQYSNLWAKQERHGKKAA